MTETTLPRIGVIGAGHWGKNLVRNFDALGVLAIICDTDRETLGRMSEMYPGAKTELDPAALLVNPEIDAVVISTPAATHGAVVAKALDAGKHVFVEKPLCLDLEEGRRLRALAEERGLTLMVGHLLLYHPAFIALRACIESGALGTLRYITSTRLSLGKIRREENALWSFAPHDISIILNLAKRAPERISTNGGAFVSPGIADTTLTHMSFSDGLQAHIYVSWLHPYKHQELVVVGSDAMAVFNDVAPGPDKLLLYRHVVDWRGAAPTINKADAEPIPYANTEPLRNECQHFIECVTTGRRPTSDAEEGLRVLQVLDASQTSLTSGHPQVISATAV